MPNKTQLQKNNKTTKTKKTSNPKPDRKLEYTLTNDLLFKMMFVKYPDLLKKLVSELLYVEESNITQFEITNSEIPPEALGEKFCRLDINMTVNKQRVDLEIQVRDETDYPERSLYYWAREYSSALNEGNDYIKLPRVTIISIVDFKLFDGDDLHSEFRPLEVTRHTLLTDKQCLHYFELPKLTEEIKADDELKLWLSLFKAKTEEDLKKIEEMRIPIMEEAIGAYRQVKATDEFKEAARLYSLARHNEAAARRYERETERAKWEVVVADKDAKLADKDAKLADNAAELNAKDAEIARLRALVGEK